MKTTAKIDRWVAHTLSRIGEGGMGLGDEIRLVRRLCLSVAPLFVVLPLVLASVLGPAAALPLGVSLAAVLFLVAFAGLIAVTRLMRYAAAVAERAAMAAHLPFELCPGVVLVLDPQGMVLSAGGRDAETFGLDLRPGPGRAFLDSVHVSDRIAFAQMLDRLRQGDRRAVVDLRLEPAHPARARGAFVNVRMDMTARCDALGTLKSIVAQLTDIETELAAHACAEEAGREADLANEAKQRFLAAVSHELRTPLNAILGFSDILKGEYFGKLANERQREYVELIHQSGSHLLSVVNAMLDVSRIEAGRYELLLEPFDMARTVQDCEKMLSLQARSRGIVLASRIGRTLGEVVADQRAVRQIIINLVGNAIKFTEAGGSVIIDAERRDDHVALTVSDTGIGIAPEKIAGLGRPFTQIHNELSRPYEGSGLGLSLVKGLTALHGGSFTIASQPGEGTVVTVTLPLDGSGAVEMLEGANENNAVEFPPRLKDAAKEETASRKGSRSNDAAAKAKIA